MKKRRIVAFLLLLAMLPTVFIGYWYLFDGGKEYYAEKKQVRRVVTEYYDTLIHEHMMDLSLMILYKKEECDSTTPGVHQSGKTPHYRPFKACKIDRISIERDSLTGKSIAYVDVILKTNDNEKLEGMHILEKEDGIWYMQYLY